MTDKQDRSIGELFSELASETSTLVHQEITLAKTELTEKASKAGRNSISLALGAAVAYAALLVLLACAIVLLNRAMPLWLSMLVVSAIAGVIGAVLVSKALSNLRQLDPAPRQTIETLREDAQWAKQQMK